MIKTTIWRQVVIAALLAGGSFTVAASPPPPPPVSYGVEEDVFHPVRARQGMVASVDALATRVGVDILRQGGNAVDAAVAVGYALGVTRTVKNRSPRISPPARQAASPVSLLPWKNTAPCR